MSTIQDLPDEILKFLSTDPPQSLIVRGHPGTGKTLLSLALLCYGGVAFGAGHAGHTLISEGPARGARGRK